MDMESFRVVFADLINGVINYLPKLLLGVVILAAGWLIARLLAAMIRKLAHKIGVDSAVVRSGLADDLAQAEIRQSASELIGSLFFWLIFLSSVPLALDHMGLATLISPLQVLVSYLPRLLAAIIVVIVGSLLAQLLGQGTKALAINLGIEFHQGMERTVRTFFLVIAVIVAIQQMGFDVSLLTNSLTNIIAITLAGLALAFGLGGRDIVRNVLAGHYVREYLTLGDHLEVDGVQGTLEGIGTISAEVSVEGERMVIPNTRLTETQIKIRAGSGLVD